MNRHTSSIREIQKSSSAPPSTANIDNGWDWINQSHRSLVAHELGYPLYHSINESAQHIVTEEVDALLPFLKRQSEPIDSGWENVFGKAFNDWDNGNKRSDVLAEGDIQRNEVDMKVIRNERRLTECIGNELDVFFQNRNLQARRFSHLGEGVNADLILSTKAESEPLVVFELGITKDANDKWWAKVGQGSMYLKRMTDLSPTNRINQFTKPLLLVAATIETADSKDVTTAQDSHSAVKRKVLRNGRLGIFLCWVKETTDSNKQIRSTLLWRMESSTQLTTMDMLQEYSQAFGKVLIAANNLAVWRENNDTTGSNLRFKSLGPNCCLLWNNGAAGSSNNSYVRLYNILLLFHIMLSCYC
jgi:hypothetical protein